jgi:hypothetical protein
VRLLGASLQSRTTDLTDVFLQKEGNQAVNEEFVIEDVEGSVACYWSFNFKVEELCGIMIQKSICEIGIEVFLYSVS